MKFRYDKENEELVVSEASRIEYHQLSLWLTRHVKGYRYMPAFKWESGMDNKPILEMER